jgi:hypothetical protein
MPRPLGFPIIFSKKNLRPVLVTALMAADGVATRVIAREVNCAIGTAAKWRVRYAKDRTIEESAVASIILDHAMMLPYKRIQSG